MVKPRPTPKPARQVPTGIRIPAELLEQVDAFAKRKAEETGIPVNRTDAILYLVRKGLAAERGKQ